MTDNEGVHFPSKNTVVLDDREMPEIGAEDVLIETEKTLVSTGTELMMLTDSHVSKESVLPFSPGYNNIGTIVDVGEDVDEDVIGERVATYGRHRRYQSRAYSGCYHIPSKVSDDEAVFFTIAEIVMNGIRRSGLQFGEGVGVYGLGLLGQLTVRLAELAGGHPVVGFDIADDRLDHLPETPGIAGLNPGSDGWEDRLDSLTDGRLADVVFEVTGNPDVIPSEFDALGEEGRFVVLGSPRGSSEFDFNRLCHQPGHVIIGAHNQTHPHTATAANPWTRGRHVELFFELLDAGRIEVDDLITHTESYRNAPEVYDMLLEDRTQALGVVFEW